jgi:hypothetical protein
VAVNIETEFVQRYREAVGRVMDNQIVNAVRDAAVLGTGVLLGLEPSRQPPASTVRVPEPSPQLTRLRAHGQEHGIDWTISRRMDRADLVGCWQLVGHRHGADVSYLFDRTPTVEELDRTLDQAVWAFQRHTQREGRDAYGRSPAHAARLAARELVQDGGRFFDRLSLRLGASTRVPMMPRTGRKRHPENPALFMETDPCT